MEHLLQTILSLRESEQQMKVELSELRTSAQSSEQIAQQKSKETRSLSA